jgi:hypothetical protein
MSNTMTYNCKAFNVTKAAPYVFNVELNRPKKMNVDLITTTDIWMCTIGVRVWSVIFA